MSEMGEVVPIDSDDSSVRTGAFGVQFLDEDAVDAAQSDTARLLDCRFSAGG
ncbi:hypothetical protein PEM37_34015 [Streptomyces sp. AD681]|uniref:hypothetical protein n=1 Tax=Streptomyces sp. AD681 TaxID=3019069 RepID=UPI0022F1D7F7|nr:hypothetical protein [Streptomyces sp. AD681]MDA5146539.1 hypothetical protein [Streptomyces sp. AD681]